MELKVINDRVLVKIIDKETVTKFGIVIPDSVTEKSDQGIVLAVGKGRLDKLGNHITPEVNVNDKVIFNKFGGTVVRINGEDLLVLKEDYIFAVMIT